MLTHCPSPTAFRPRLRTA